MREHVSGCLHIGAKKEVGDVLSRFNISLTLEFFHTDQTNSNELFWTEEFFQGNWTLMNPFQLQKKKNNRKQ